MISLTAETLEVPFTPESSYGFITQLSNELLKLHRQYSQASVESRNLLQLMPFLQQETQD